ncbi:MAG TPA: peptidoglycan-binding domain-containing protein [Bryobacteraceae bacterium]|nr:peptidoglycan-binding domain-containing protein [Bryobacteraceae bacterium]
MARALVAALLATTVLSASPVPQQTPPHKQTTQHKKTQASAHSKSKTRRVHHAAPAPSYQLHPDPERYQQIQQALADRGYFKGQVNGQWNDDSIDALKRFQTDQKLDPDGKINALSLTGLGLGPRHDGSTAATVPLSAADSAITPPDPPVIPPPPH